MKRLWSAILLLSMLLPLRSAADMGCDSVTSHWLREWYQWGELQHYLDNYCDVTTYLSETTGEWATPEPLLVSINGNSYRSNRYYLNGFRVDSRTEAGEALYRPDMFTHSMTIDYNRGVMYWRTDSVRPSQVRLSGQGGGVGSYSRLARWLQELQEGNSAIKRAPKPEVINLRRHIVGAGHADAVYTIPLKGVDYTQHAYFDYGVRRQLQYDYDGITGTWDADYYHIQLDGELPIAPNKVMDALHYILRVGYRADGNSEFGYNANELSRRLTHSFSLYGHKDYGQTGHLVTGVTYGLQRDRHRQLEFSRNVIDVDGESLEPWYADGHTHELNWAIAYQYAILPWLRLHVDDYNSFLAFRPSEQEWTNKVYLQGYEMSSPLQLYDYRWHSESFVAGMLENTLTIAADYPVLRWLRLRGEVSATLDGMLLTDKSIVTPCWEGKADIHIAPTGWFRMDLIAAHYRIPYSYEQVRFLSDHYLSGEVYAGTKTLLTTTGGRYHRLGKGLRQPRYVAVDVPIVFTIGRHEISVLSSFKKYYDTWSVRLSEESVDSYEPLRVTQGVGADLSYSIYRMEPHERMYEVVPAERTGSGIWDSPVFVSNLIKYAYNGRNVFASLSWQSYCLSGTSALGNSMQAEDIQVLSESLADPNYALVNGNMQQSDAGIRSLGRLYQDRAYIARLQVGVNITEHWQLSLSGKFRDGIPFRALRTYVDTDGEGHSQAIVWNHRTRGINVVDGNFGERYDSFFNFDLRLKYRGTLRGVPLSVQAMCYNILDFATELNEYSMYYNGRTGVGAPSHRYPLSLCTPRGLSLTLCIGLSDSH